MHSNAVMLRAAVLSGGYPLPTVPKADDLVGFRVWLGKVWGDSQVADAVEVASPALAERVRAVQSGYDLTVRQRTRMVRSVSQYVLRMNSRATPFGLFAGVAPVTLSSTSAVRWGSDHRVSSQVDAEWLSGIVRMLEQDTKLLRNLRVVRNNLCFLRGDRLVVPCTEHDSSESTTRPEEISVRLTKAVEVVLDAVDMPVPVGELAAKLSALAPAIPQDSIIAMLASLVRQRVLITELRAPTTCVDPLGHLIARVGQVPVPSHLASVVAGLQATQDALADHPAEVEAGRRRELRTTAVAAMAAIGPPRQALMLDLRLDVTVAVPTEVAKEAESSVAVLTRLSAHPCGFDIWIDYHNRFIERYGIGSLVPVLELVNPDTGLGLPARYHGSVLKPPPAASLTGRDTALLELVQCATLAGVHEVVLDDEAVERLTAPGWERAQVAGHTELRFHLSAIDRESLSAGDFRLTIVGASRAAGTTTGRFLHLFDANDADQFRDAYRDLARVDRDGLPVQVSAPPLFARTRNVVRNDEVLPDILALSEYDDNPSSALKLADLAVSGDVNRLWLWSLSRSRSVEPTMFNALDFRHRAQPLARFLCEISQAHTVPVGKFYWGAAASMPYLPRIRYGRTIISPARWRLAPRDLDGTFDIDPARWREERRLSRYVWLGNDDEVIRIDLHDADQRAILRWHVDRLGDTSVTEAPSPQDAGWLDGHAHEIVVPLSATNGHSWPKPTHRPGCALIHRDHAHLPGISRYLSLKLIATPARHATIVCDHLAELTDAIDSVAWWLPYRDTESHLRIRLRLPSSADYAQALEAAGAWTDRLSRAGLAQFMQVDSYHPETGRYGHGSAMLAAEQFFAADSQVAAAQLRSGVDPTALGAASMVDMARTMLGFRDGVHWLVDTIDRDRGRSTDRAIQSQAIKIASSGGDLSGLTEATGSGHAARAWRHRRAALVAYRARLTGTGITPREVLPSLLHLHHVRMAGLNPEAEQTTHRLARAVALSHHARRQRRPR
ncbi:hypothetical protein GCM10010124_02500 [Pilimelia terevasa]|uniref:Uncharacterized protein n=1 Tax=Pilimelia terevasa TaxID=53372 RepID=A0A8J3FEB0_9ACTN|nr:lantibiotic dehydratase [Pilimelia terevasa]GGK13443.1 hypothetical protein GCM10010124_02500 [Pilimelia terevasa]